MKVFSTNLIDHTVHTVFLEAKNVWITEIYAKSENTKPLKTLFHTDETHALNEHVRQIKIWAKKEDHELGKDQ
jgi:hypothetical protein